jgi:pyridoxamine 5'-phosphate oxidase
VNVNDQELQVRLRDLPVFDIELPTFDPRQAPDNPSELFVDWLLEAINAGVREPHAMTLSTVDAAGRPNSRMLILKGVADGRWLFATSRESRKGQELAETPWAAASFYWSELGRQVRIRGRVVDGGDEPSNRDFLARSEGSRAEALVGNQGRVLRDPADLEAALEEARARLANQPELIADHWRLCHLIPDQIEFWQADEDRRRTRLLYTLDQQTWIRELLWP